MTQAYESDNPRAYRGDPDSPAAIEREVDAERGRVAETIDALQEKISVSGLTDEIVRAVQRNGGDIFRNLGRRASENPIPLILTGVGIAWLMAGSGRRRTRGYDYDEDYLWESDEDLHGEDVVGTRRYGTSTVRPYGTAGTGGTYGSVRDDSHSTGERLKGAASSMSHRAGSAASTAYGRAGGTASSVYDKVAGAASAAYGKVAGAAGSASEGAGRAGSGIGERARHAGDAIGEGAYQARRRASEYSRYARRRVDDMMEEQPLVMGALAFAVGAAIGGALPRTRTEDEYLGEYSDEAWDSAREMAANEAEKARRVAGAVAEEAREIADEKFSEADDRVRHGMDKVRSEARDAADRLRDTAKHEAERAGSEARDAADRLRETAKGEAERQDLGNPNKPA